MANGLTTTRTVREDTNPGSIRLSKEEVLFYLEHARGLIAEGYRKENCRARKEGYNWGSVDQVALHKLETDGEIVVIGVTLCRENVNLHAHPGYLSPEGELIWTDRGTTKSYTLTDFRGTTVSRFGTTICDVLTERAIGGNKDLKDIMAPNVIAYAARTKSELAKYIGQRGRA